MSKYTNREIAESLALWNEYFNVSSVMSDEEFYALTLEERLKMLVEAFGEDDPDDDPTSEYGR
jgi:hypothetical protein